MTIYQWPDGPHAEVYPWAHFSDPRAEDVLRALWPNANILVDGDCGSVWGEKHENPEDCPNPHVLLKNATDRQLRVLAEYGIGFAADLEEDWGETIVEYRWTENPSCVEEVG